MGGGAWWGFHHCSSNEPTRQTGGEGVIRHKRPPVNGEFLEALYVAAATFDWGHFGFGGDQLTTGAQGQPQRRFKQHIYILKIA